MTRWVHTIEGTSKDEAEDLGVLGINAVAGEEPLAHAFHALAREVHPDRWRGTYGATGMQRVVRAYARLTLAYARLRERCQLDRRRGSTLPPRTAGSTLPPRVAGSTLPPRVAGSTLPPRVAGSTLPPRVADSTLPPGIAAASASGVRSIPTSTGGSGVRTMPSTTGAGASAGGSGVRPMPSTTNVDPLVRAQRVAGFRAAAEDALGRADLAGALLNLRLAVAADPTSAELRAELAEFEAVLKGR